MRARSHPEDDVDELQNLPKRRRIDSTPEGPKSHKIKFRMSKQTSAANMPARLLAEVREEIADLRSRWQTESEEQQAEIAMHKAKIETLEAEMHHRSLAEKDQSMEGVIKNSASLYQKLWDQKCIIHEMKDAMRFYKFDSACEYEKTRVLVDQFARNLHSDLGSVMNADLRTNKLNALGKLNCVSARMYTQLYHGLQNRVSS